MNEQDKTQKPRKVFKRNRKPKTTRLGLATLLITTVLVVFGVVASGGFSNESQAQSVNPPVDALNVGAFSSSWSCPIAGDPGLGDSVILSNADPSRSAQVKVVAHANDGAILGREDIEVENNSSKEILLSDITDNSDASLYIESFAGSVVPFRVLNLSDGIEFIECDATTTSVQHFLGIETVRNSNGVLVLANPYTHSVVVDILVNTTDDSSGVAISGSTEKRGVVISGRGRTVLDLQETFGRYSSLNLRVSSRSGFFSGEVLQTYDGANDIFGETIILGADLISRTTTSFIPGTALTRFTGSNIESFSQSLVLEATSLDNRFIAPEPQAFLANSISNVAIPEHDYGQHLLSVTVESANVDSRGIIGSWIRGTNNGVASSSGLSRSSKGFLAPIRGGDILYVYNPSDAASELEIKYSAIDTVTSISIEAKSFVAIELEFSDPNVSSMIRIDSSREIFIGVTNERQSRYSNGINLAL